MNIKIVICFIILYFLPLASATADNVWIAKSSGFIKSNESLIFENYLIGAQILSGTKAAITVYRDKNQIASSDFNMNDFKKYDNIGITLLGIKGNYSWISISKLENKDVWRPFARKLLKWGEKYAIENYTIDVDVFGTDSVNLTVSNKSMKETNVFFKDGFKDYADLRIAVRNINRTGFIELEFFTNKVPVIKAEVFTDKDEYFPDESIQFTVNITGDAVQNVVGVALESSPHAEIKPDMFSATGINSKSFYSQISQLPANSTLTISAKIETRDYYNAPYITTVHKDVVITPVVAIVKRVPFDTDDENVPVHLYVYNSGLSNKSIYVRDTIPEEFAAKELDWNIELAPRNFTILAYNVTLKKPGTYIFPPAMAQWNGQSSLSKKVKTSVHMPYVSITKTAVNNKSLTDVELIITNTGDRSAMVEVSDKVPGGYPVVNGNTTWAGFLDSGESSSITYSLRGDIDALPAANATYRDIFGTIRQAQSNAVPPKRTDAFDKPYSSPINAGRYEIVSFMILSFLVIAGIIGSTAFMAYLITRFKMRSK